MDWIEMEAPRALRRIKRRARGEIEDETRWAVFEGRLDASFERLFRLHHRLYGWRFDFAWQLEDLVMVAARAVARRPERWWRRDLAADDGWLHDRHTVWGQAYTERFAGTLQGVAKRADHLERLGLTHLHLMPPYDAPEGRNDGGYAVSDYRRVRSDLGTIDDLGDLIEGLADRGIGVVLDFVANHTSDEHPWAEGAKAGDPEHQAFYLMFDDRTLPDRFEPHLREIFPDRGADAFTWRSDVAGPNGGKWVWSTFYEFQWDLDYRNPQVLAAMAGELGFLLDLGPAVVRMDATPFLWKREGTSCENLPEAHTLLQIFNWLVGMVAPSTQMLSEAIVHPDDVARFVRPDECRLGYNPLVMALTWEALATRDVRMLADALDRRSHLPPGCQWVTYLRLHDDIGWGFADEDAHRLGIDPGGHRDFLNAFYAGEFPASFSRGMRFQENPWTGDARISGTLASLAGLEAALESGDPAEVDLAVGRILAAFTVMMTSVGIPLLYLGDEIGQLNDHRYAEDPLLAADNRWAHRPFYDWEGLAEAEAGRGPRAEILSSVIQLLELRRRSPAFDGGEPDPVPTGTRGVVAYRRAGGGEAVIVAVNLTDRPQRAVLELGDGWVDLLDDEGETLSLDRLDLAPYEARVARAAAS